MTNRQTHVRLAPGACLARGRPLGCGTKPYLAANRAEGGPGRICWGAGAKGISCTGANDQESPVLVKGRPQTRTQR
jgi:hypothetical protein